MPHTPEMLRYCGYCGSPFDPPEVSGELSLSASCGSCKRLTYAEPGHRGPALLVLTSIFAENRVLLLKRGVPPYLGCWAPPGGFVEPGESLEAAAIREAEEEVGIALAPEQLIPHGILSLPAMNQVHVTFCAILDRMVELRPRLPEAMSAAWFFESEIPMGELWAPARDFDISRVFESVRTGRLDFYQQTDASLRLITHHSEMIYLWRRST